MAEITVIAALMKAGTEARQTAVEFMIGLLERGETVVIGTKEAIPAGEIVGKANGKALAVKARSTREAFLLNAPGRVENASIGSPFYYELELKAEA